MWFKPGGVEIPVIVNVLGPEGATDQLDVDNAFITVNEILIQANVQLNVVQYAAGVEIGNGDRLLGEAEHDEALRRVLQIPGPPGDFLNGNGGDSLKGNGWGKRHRHGCPITIYIADDVWLERPDLVLWNAAFFPAAFMELGGQPEEAGRILAREIALSAGLPPSSDPESLLFEGGGGTLLVGPVETGPIRTFAEQIGLLRSPLAEGFSPAMLDSLRCPRWQGALYHQEVIGRWGDPLDDVTIDDAGGSRIGVGQTDLVSFTAKAGTVGADPSDRELILKALFNSAVLHESIGIDTYMRGYAHRNDILTGDVLHDNDAVIGFGPGFVGAINLIEPGEWTEIPGATVDVDVVGGRTRVKTTIPLGPFDRLSSILPSDLFDDLTHGNPIDLTVGASAFILGDTGFTVERDAIWYMKLGACPKPLPCVTEDTLLDGFDPLTFMPGINVRTALVGDPGDLPIDESPREILDGLFGGPDPVDEAGRDLFGSINFGTDPLADRGFFGSPEGAPDRPYPGIEPPLATDRLFGTQARGVIDLEQGLHAIGIHGDDRATLRIGGVEVGRTFHDHPWTPNGDGEVMPPINGGPDDDKMGILRRGDFVFEVKQAGFYSFDLRALGKIAAPSGNGPQILAEGDGVASLEVTVVLPDGTRVLLGDTTSGSPPVFVLPDGPADPGELVVLDFDDSFAIGPPFRSFGDRTWFIEFAGSNKFARSGTITHTETSTLELTVEVTGGQITFDYEVSSEANFDLFRFFIDGQEQQAWSGEAQGTASFPVEAGKKVFAWTYEKDGSDSRGSDQVRIDNVTYPQAAQ